MIRDGAHVRQEATGGATGAAPASAHSANLAGIAAMVVSIFAFTIGDTIVKYLGQTMPVGQIMALRGVFALLFFAAFVAATGPERNPLALLRPIRDRKVMLRTAAEVGATTLFFAGLAMMPLADASAIAQFAPLALTAGAALFLGEPVGWRRWLAAIAGFIGVMMIMRPASPSFNMGSFAILGCVACIVLRDLVTRRIGTAVPTTALTAVTIFALTLFGFVLGLVETWIRPGAVEVAWLALMALLATLGYHFIIKAMQAGDVAVITPIRYLSIPMTVVLGYVAFGDVPDLQTCIGIVIVIAAGIYTAHRERVRARGGEA